MHIAILGAGFTGLSAGYELSKHGHTVTILEKEAFTGGLGAGFKNRVDDYPPSWEWNLEQFYHHWFTNDTDIFDLIKELGLEDKIIIKRPITSSWYHGQKYQLDSAQALLSFSPLPFIDRVRTGIILGLLKILPNGQFLERYKTHEILPKLVGKKSYAIIWEPLLKGKFATHYKDINFAWFWARINKRTPKLAYFQGGFQALANDIAEEVKKKAGEIILNTTIENIENVSQQSGNRAIDQWYIQTNNQRLGPFDSIIVTTPFPVFTKLFKNLPQEYVQKYSSLKGIGAYALVLVLREQFFSDNTYWLSIHEPTWPFLVLAEHTNFMSSHYYGGDHVLYVANYLEAEHELMSLSKESLIEKCLPYLQQINPQFSTENLKQSWLWRTPFAQPLTTINHSQNIPPLETPLPNVYLATMSQVYPWDRGTNYAVELGKKVADIIKNSEK